MWHIPNEANGLQNMVPTARNRLLVWFLSQSPDINSTEHAFHSLKNRLKTDFPRNKDQLKVAAVYAWKSISKEETK